MQIDLKKTPRLREADKASRLTANSGIRPFIILSSAVLVIASLYLAQTLLVPLTLSILLAFLLNPAVSYLQHKGLHQTLAVMTVVVMAFSILAVVGWVLYSQTSLLLKDLPQYRGNLSQKVKDLRGASQGSIAELRETVEGVMGEIEKLDPAEKTQRKPVIVKIQREEVSLLRRLPAAIAPLLEPLANSALVIVLVIFMLLRRQDLRNRLIQLVGSGRLAITTKALEDAGERISHYLLTQTALNGLYGIIISIGLFFIGLPYALVWGFLAAVLRFVPYVGPWIAALLPIALSLAVFEGWEGPLLIFALFLVMELFTNMVLEPRYYGQSAGVSEVALLVAIAFWTWLWGPAGLVLATPLTVIMVAIGKYFPQFKSFVILMDKDSKVDPSVSFYQRLLASDQDQASRIVEEALATEPLANIYDEIFIPSLNYGKRDRRGGLDKEDQTAMIQTNREIIEDLHMRKAHGAISAEIKSWQDNEQKLVNNDHPPLTKVLGYPAEGEADELALEMLDEFLNKERFELTVLSSAMLTSEVINLLKENPGQIVCVASLPPGGLAQARRICKRLRTEFPNLKLVVGRWGPLGEAEDATFLIEAGANQVADTLMGSSHQINELSQLNVQQ